MGLLGCVSIYVLLNLMTEKGVEFAAVVRYDGGESYDVILQHSRLLSSPYGFVIIYLFNTAHRVCKCIVLY